MSSRCRRLVLILGDQLDQRSAALSETDPTVDMLLMLEVLGESTRIPVHKARIVQFLAAMRHFAVWLRKASFRLDYRKLDHPASADFETALGTAIRDWEPTQLVLVEPGEFGVRETILRTARSLSCPVKLLKDQHFLVSRERFGQWREGRKSLVMEYFYREIRREQSFLMEDGKPAAGKWNFDKDNRKPFGREGPGWTPEPIQHPPTPILRQVLKEVQTRFADNPGSVDNFHWPVTREQALETLDDFIENRLSAFGPFQDAMWTGQPWLYHGAIAPALNLKLLNPREVLQRVSEAYVDGQVDIRSAEGFGRQIIGWREYVRGIYWDEMPNYLNRNELSADKPLPGLYWSGETEMNCLREVVGQTLRFGYAHHIQRLMVTGLFALLMGVRPREVHEWYLSIYVDAVEWVEAPNTLGMSQFADGGLLASKPYAASGRYIQRMSNYCRGCRFKPDSLDGESACPMTVLYWDFLIRHRERFAAHPRAALQWKSLEKLSAALQLEIQRRASTLRDKPV